MKNVLFAAFVALCGVTTANYASNGTHYLDPDFNNAPIRHFDCDVNQGQASAHFNHTVKILHHAHRHSNILSRAAGALKRYTVPTPITVPLYIHIITKQASAGSITPKMISDQTAALNAAYRPYGITFNLLNTTTTANDAWAVAAGSDMTALKQALRAGSYSALNLYFHTDLSGGILGTCTLPSQVSPLTPPSAYFSDGCNIAAATMPGGAMTGYNLGKTAVHETGHWLGLLHTFEGYSCSGPGDSVSDTPAESVPTDGCPSKPAKDSCAAVAGVDPIHNYMDYSTDACYSSFTPGQVRRIDALWAQYRKGF